MTNLTLNFDRSSTLTFKDIMCNLFMDIYKHFIHILHIFWWDVVFFLLFFYKEDIDVLYKFQVLLGVYVTDILCTFYRHYKAVFWVHFFDICSSFG